MTLRLFRTFLLLSAIVVTAVGASNVAAQIEQAAGTDYLIFEAEDFTIDDLNDPDFGWTVIDVNNPIEAELPTSNPGTILVPPPNANMSGGLALFDQTGGGDFADQVGWDLNFATPGEYFLYARYSLYDMRDLSAPSYKNEDSIYLPPFDLQDDPAGDETEIRDERAGQSTLTRVVGADFVPEGEAIEVFPTDSCRVEDEPWVLSEEECQREDVSLDGQYHWQKIRFSDDSQENAHASYIVEQTGVALDFSIATRERGSSLDVLVFSQNDGLGPEDLDSLLTGPVDPLAALDDGSLTDEAARIAYVHDVIGTWIGDSNVDGEFNSGDLVVVFQAGEYEDELAGNSVWATGDWNGDNEFNTSDLVFAFQDGGFELGPRDVAAVPEPSSAVLLLIGMLACFRRKR